MSLLRKIIGIKASKTLTIPVKSSIWLPKYIAEFLHSSSKEGEDAGKLIITFDVETANDFVHWRSLNDAILIARASRKAIINIKKLSEEHDIPITWLCTGHTLLDGCQKHRVGIFRWATRKQGFDDFWAKHDWFHFDPGTNYERDPEWYFGDIISKLLDSRVEHEIGSHTFSHLRCDLASEEEFMNDMALLSQVFKERGLKLASHSYPFDFIGHLYRLQQFGVQICRLKCGNFPSRIVDAKKNDIILVYESLYGFMYPRIIKFGIDIAIKDATKFVWLLHPEDVYWEIGKKIFSKLLEYSKKRREEGMLTVTTMGKEAIELAR